MLIPTDIHDIPSGMRRRSGDRLRELNEFLESDLVCCEVDLDGRSFAAERQGYNMLRKENGLPLKIVTRNKRLFLVKSEVEE